MFVSVSPVAVQFYMYIPSVSELYIDMHIRIYTGMQFELFVNAQK